VCFIVAVAVVVAHFPCCLFGKFMCSAGLHCYHSQWSPFHCCVEGRGSPTHTSRHSGRINTYVQQLKVS